jgi:hypothetical protein
MIYKVLAATIAVALLMAVMPSSLAQSDTIKPYQGWAGPDSSFYGMKLFFQKMDISLTGDPSARLQKQMTIADERLSEAYAMSIANNTDGVQAAMDEYENTLGDINQTMDNEDVDDVMYSDAIEHLDDQQNQSADLVNNSTLAPCVKNRWSGAFNATEQIKNGRPFIYYNNTSYFVPPGQMKKATNLTQMHVPPGLAKKGYVAAKPISVNGSLLWPWDAGYDLYNNSKDNSTFVMDGPNNGKLNNGNNNKLKVHGSNGNGNGNNK